MVVDFFLRSNVMGRRMGSILFESRFRPKSSNSSQNLGLHAIALAAAVAERHRSVVLRYAFLDIKPTT